MFELNDLDPLTKEEIHHIPTFHGVILSLRESGEEVLLKSRELTKQNGSRIKNRTLARPTTAAASVYTCCAKVRLGSR